jgi:hypothetical protein
MLWAACGGSGKNHGDARVGDAGVSDAAAADAREAVADAAEAGVVAEVSGPRDADSDSASFGDAPLPATDGRQAADRVVPPGVDAGADGVPEVPSPDAGLNDGWSVDAPVSDAGQVDQPVVLQPDASVTSELPNRDDAEAAQDGEVTPARPEVGPDTWVDPCVGVVCNDSLYCNGTESCDPTTGRCVRKDVPSCGSHGSCNEFTDSCSCDWNFGGSSCNQCAPGSIGVYPDCQQNPCTPNPCGNGGTCSVSGSNPVCACTGHWDAATSCTTCAIGWMGADCNNPVVADPCAGITCSGHGVCGGGNCLCLVGYVGATCGACAAGYQGYPTCVPIPPPAPTISGLAIDCSSAGGDCQAGGTTYSVSFSVTNATSCTAATARVSGGGSSGSVTSCVISGNSGAFSYTTGSTGSDVIRITVNATGPGGSAAPTYIDVPLV